MATTGILKAEINEEQIQHKSIMFSTLYFWQSSLDDIYKPETKKGEFKLDLKVKLVIFINIINDYSENFKNSLFCNYN